jgi:hypothetical protein
MISIASGIIITFHIAEVEDVCELLMGNVTNLTLALTQRTVATSLDNVRTDLSSTDVRLQNYTFLSKFLSLVVFFLI